MEKSLRTWILMILGAGFCAQLLATGEFVTPDAGGHLLAPSEAASSPVNVLLRNGMALHDKGDFDGAIVKYREALAAQPGNDVAWYEIANSLVQKQDLAGALQAAETGLKLNGRAVAPLYMLIGNVQDDLGAPEKAVEAYQAALRDNPKLAMVYFNLGVTLIRLKRLEEARRALQHSLLLSPDHPGSHISLALAYSEAGFRFPAWMAATRFLMLEPAGKRADNVRSLVTSIYVDSVTVEKDSKGHAKVKVMVSESPTKDEGDFSLDDIDMQALAGAMKAMGDEKLESFGCFLWGFGMELFFKEDVKKPIRDRGAGFAANYYLPFFKALLSAEMTGPFTRRLCPADNQKVNPADEAKFNKWLSQYQWPTDTSLAELSGKPHSSSPNPADALSPAAIPSPASSPSSVSPLNNP